MGSIYPITPILQPSSCHVRGLRGEHFRGMELITTHTNHNHEELLENIDAYRGSWGKLHTGGRKTRQIICWFAELSLSL